MVTNILYCNSDGSCARLGMYKRLYKRLLMQAAAAQCLTSCMPDPPCRLVFDITHKWMAGDRDGVAAKGRWRPLRVSTDALTLDTPPTPVSFPHLTLSTNKELLTSVMLA